MVCAWKQVDDERERERERETVPWQRGATHIGMRRHAIYTAIATGNVIIAITALARDSKRTAAVLSLFVDAVRLHVIGVRGGVAVIGVTSVCLLLTGLRYAMTMILTSRFIFFIFLFFFFFPCGCCIVVFFYESC